MLHAQSRHALPIKESAISLSTTDNDPGSHPTNTKTPITAFFFLHDDFMRKRKKFSVVLKVYKLSDSDIDEVRDFNANECGKDGLKTKYPENARVQKGERKLRHLLMVGAKLIEFVENFTLRLSKAPGAMKDFSFISDSISERLRECCVWMFSFKGNTQDIFHHDSETMSIRSMLTQPNSHIHMLTDMSLDETPDIHSDHKNFLIVDPTEVFLVEKNDVFISVYLRNKTPNSLVSAQASHRLSTC